MRRLKAPMFATWALAIALAAAPAAALAGPPAELKSDITSRGATVTLGDLFADAGSAAGVVAARIAPGQTAVLDATQVQYLARANGVDWGNPQGLRRIIVTPAAPALAPASDTPAARAEPRARSRPPVLVYLHSLNAGEVIRAEDLSWSRDAVAPGEAPREPDAAIGLAARRPLREGDAVSLRDLAAPLVIKKDDIVSVAFNSGGLSLVLQAKALQGAAAGEPLSVLNTASKKIIQAVASGPGQAVVGPEAEQLKLAARGVAPAPSALAFR